MMRFPMPFMKRLNLDCFFFGFADWADCAICWVADLAACTPADSIPMADRPPVAAWPMGTLNSPGVEGALKLWWSRFWTILTVA